MSCKYQGKYEKNRLKCEDSVFATRKGRLKVGAQET